MKIVHAADLHLDSPLRGLERYDGAPVDRVRGATRAAFRRVVDLCLAERARFLVLAGDVFDGDWKDVSTGLFFIAELRRLRALPCDVLLVRGNHDFELTRALPYPDHVHAFAAPGAGPSEPRVFERDGVAFHGVSYADKKVTTSLLPFYAPPIDGLLNVGVLHTNATGDRAHASYAPCSVPQLVAHGYDYWALGHVHGHAILHRDPWVVYPGNTQGRHVGEDGPKGCVVVDVVGARIDRVRFVETSVMTFAREVIRLAPGDDHDDAREKALARVHEVVAANAGLASIRLELRGACRAHAAFVASPRKLADELRAAVIGLGVDAWLEKIVLATSPVLDLAAQREAPGLVGDVLRDVARMRDDESEENVRFHRLFEPLKHLGRAVDFDFSNRELRARILDGVEALLAQRMIDAGD
jgi:DNA repair exonuclease SbcCD nuclease subunit